MTALRLVRALVEDGEQLAAVFFREDGVYQSQSGRALDAGTPGLSGAWEEVSAVHDVPLLLCSSAAQRRFSQPPGGGFREAGLVQLMDLMKSCDRVVTF